MLGLSKAKKRTPAIRERCCPRDAFTLIELLVVIAIIAILALIAIPNFLEAHVRAKVSRSMSDLRSIAAAVSAYSVDYGAQPTSSDDRGRQISPYPPAGVGPEFFETRMGLALTTPVAYISRLPLDPFAASSPDPDNDDIFEGPGYHYGSIAYARANSGREGVDKLSEYATMMRANPGAIQYILVGHGPDRDHDDDEDMADRHAAVSYDPTNGTLSSGDIVYLGPGGFAR